jgi:hypothetical protein
MNVYPGARYKLVRTLTAISHDDDARSKLVTLAPGTILIIAGVLQGSMFIQVTCEGTAYDVAVEDLEEAAESLPSA